MWRTFQSRMHMNSMDPIRPVKLSTGKPVNPTASQSIISARINATGSITYQIGSVSGPKVRNQAVLPQRSLEYDLNSSRVSPLHLVLDVTLILGQLRRLRHQLRHRKSREMCEHAGRSFAVFLPNLRNIMMCMLPEPPHKACASPAAAERACSAA